MKQFFKVLLPLFFGFNLNLLASTENDFEALLEDITEIATKKKLNIDNTPGIISIIKGEELVNMGISIFEINTLNMIPGFFFNVSRKSTESTKYIYAIDGKNINTQLTGVGYLPLIATASIERIEIIRGASSSLYGSNAYSAFINIVTKKDVNLIWTNYVQYDGSNFGVNIGAIVSDTISGVDVSARVNSISSDGPSHTVTQDTASIYGLSSNTPTKVNLGMRGYEIDVNLKSKNWELSYNRHNTQVNSDFGISNMFIPPYDDKIHVEETKDILEIKNFTTFFAWDITSLLGYFKFDQKISDSYLAPAYAFAEVDYIMDARFKEQNLYAQSELNKQFDTHDILLGMRVQQAKLLLSDYFATYDFLTSTSFETPSYVGEVMPDVDRKIYSLWFQDYFTLNDDVTLVLNLRYDKVSDIDEYTITPRIACIYVANEKHIIKAQYANAFMTPLFFSLYPADDISFIQANQNLEIDKSHNFELSHIYKDISYNLKSTLYYTDMYNVNTLRQAGNALVEAKNSSQMSGIELEFEKNFSTFDLKSNLSYNFYSKIKYVDGVEYNNDITVLPDIIANLIINKKISSTLSTTLWYNYISKQKQYYSNLTTDAKNLINLSMKYIPKSFNKKLSLVVSVNDILNQKISLVPSNNSFKAEENINSKRHFLAQLKYQF